ncbi:MAG: M28 family peptidase [Candidatus Nezhaarchaeota archaeon]|nr:M28 family peptidase [Candidatus Nezhaarchaeota archaeon]
MGLIRGGYDAYETAREHGAIGFIGVLEDYPKLGEELTYYAPYDGILRPMPGLWVSKETGDLLKSMLSKDKVSAKITLEAEIRPTITHNIYGVLPGKTDEVMIVHSHHDGPFQSAVEDASGCSVVLALAKYFTRCREQIKRTLLFLFTAGHFYGGAEGIGQKAFIEAHKSDVIARTLIDVAIEHVAKECLVKDGIAVMTENVEPRGLFTTDNPVLIDIAKKAIIKNDVERILVLPTTTPINVPTDAHLFWKNGIPIYSLISGPVYLFDVTDTPDKVAKDQLEVLTKMFIDIIRELDTVPREEIRAKEG